MNKSDRNNIKRAKVLIKVNYWIMNKYKNKTYEIKY